MIRGVALAIPLALGAALLHAVWNVLLKTSEDPLRVSARAAGSSLLITTPLAGLAWLAAGRPAFPPHAWLLAGLSGLVELAYFIFLSAAYRRGDLSVVYSLARGTAALLAVPAGLLVLQERLSPIELAAVLCLLTGIWLVRRPVASGPAVTPALLTGVAIATYSAIDRVGVRLTRPWLYGWAVWAITALLLVSWVRLEGSRGIAQWVKGSFVAGPAPATVKDETSWARACAVGLLMVSAYLLVLFALNVAPLTIVAPLRESAIVLVTGWGIWRLKERQGAWLRVGGAVVIVAGAFLLAVHAY